MVVNWRFLTDTPPDRKVGTKEGEGETATWK
jgi:hypothetical protein